MNLNDREMALYDSIAKILEKDIVYPDLAIFLQADTEKINVKYKKSWQVLESSINPDYIESLNQVYNVNIFRYDKGILF